MALVVVLAPVLTACAPEPSLPDPGTLGDGRFHQILEKIVRDNNIPALSVLVVQNSEIIESTAFGVRSFDNVIPVEEGDQWQIGSVTKSMTATLAARLVDIGLLRWDTRIEEFFSEHLEQIDRELFDITLAELLQHRAGLVRHPIPTSAEIASLDRLGFVLRVLNDGHGSNRGEFSYSNLGYLVAGVMLENATGMSWENAIETYLFSELGITNYGFGVPDPTEHMTQPVGHLLRSPTGDNRVNDYWLPITPQEDTFLDHLKLYGPAGSLFLSKQEYYKFQQVHLKGANSDSTFLSQNSFERLHVPDNGSEYAMGWYNEDSKLFEDFNLPAGERLLAHGGNTGLWSAISVLLPDSGISIFIGSNSDFDGHFDVLKIILKRLEVTE